jgi:tetratricopeptide (TPR) repeat protein
MPPESEMLTTGLEHHQAGRLNRALEIYQQVLAADPQNAEVHNLLGAVCIHLHQWPQAAGYLAEAVRLNPEYSAAHDNLGVLLAQQGQIGQAVVSFRRAAALDPRNAQTQLNLAHALLRRGPATEAVDVFQWVVQIAPDSLRAHSELAQVLSQLNRLAESLAHFRQVVRLSPDDPRAHFELAAALDRCGQTDEAIAAYQDALRLKPDLAEACVNLAKLHIDKQSYDEAVQWARRAVALRPRLAEAYLNLGNALTQQKNFSDAKAALQEATRLKPDLAQAHNNLGVVLIEEGEFAAAIDHCHRALAINPHNPDAFYNTGIALHKQGQPRAAVEQFDRALQLLPDYAEAHHNRSATLLLLGEYAEGFAEYEWRLKSRDFPPCHLRWKPWVGEALAGRTIVLCAEQGLGDTLQFIRYAAPLKQRGARVLVECSPRLHPMLAGAPGVDGCMSATTAPPPADCCAPLLSLPHRLHTTLETVPASTPYLFADPQLVATWRQKLADSRGFRVGIVWQGNPRSPGDQQRSIPLVHYGALAKVPGVRLVNLQKGPGLDQLTPVAKSWSVVDFGEALDASGGAFVDTAAIMQNLDLVVTSDTAVAHLAGALGVNVWVALQYVPDWRWLLDRDDSPWYPTMRMFRQTQVGDWAEVFQRIAGELARRVEAR